MLGYRFAGLATAIMTAFGGASAVMAHDALPGDLLYPMKIAGEHFVAATKVSAEARASYASQLATRRLAEAKIVVEDEDGGEDRAAIALGLYRDEVEKIARDQEHDGGRGGKDDARSMFTAHQSALAEIEDAVGDGISPQIELSLRRAADAEDRMERAAADEVGRSVAEEKRRIAEGRLEHEERRLRKMKERGEVSVAAEVALGDAGASIVESDVLLEDGEFDDAYAKAREALRISLRVGLDDKIEEGIDVEE